MYDLVICTTAVTRPELHRDVIPGYLQFLKGIKCLWMVNIDPILDRTVQETQSNFEKLVSNEDNIDCVFTYSDKGGSRADFYNSVANIINRAVDQESKIGYFWLEDDWNWSGAHTLESILQTETVTNRDYLQLVKREEKHVVSFNPGIWSKDLFYEVCYKKIQQPFTGKNNNPERACTFPVADVRKLVSRFILYPTFKDVGRVWQKKVKITRTFKIKE